jgi:hypothetical protein
MDNPFVFSLAFGLADTRENCIESSQDVYRRLLLRTPDSVVMTFETIAVLAVLGDGTMDQDKLKDLVRLFRPDRDGNLSLLDFVKSIDTVYKTIRLLRASVRNSMKIDRAFETLFNIAFYTVMTCVILSQIGFDPLALFLSLSSVILAFAFMIGSASSKYFEVRIGASRNNLAMLHCVYPRSPSLTSYLVLNIHRAYFSYCSVDPMTLAIVFTLAT